MNNLFSKFLPPPHQAPPSPSSSLSSAVVATITNSCSSFATAISAIVVTARETRETREAREEPLEGTSTAAPAAPSWTLDLALLLSPSHCATAALLSHAALPQFPQVTQPLSLLPNLVHSLRLLRVLSLLLSSSPSPPSLTVPLETITELLSPLLTTHAAGELLRPHLPSLLELMTSPYPLPGVPIPTALSPLLTKLAANCVSRALARHLDDRNCVRNMLMDVEELMEEGEGEGGLVTGAEGEWARPDPLPSSPLQKGTSKTFSSSIAIPPSTAICSVTSRPTFRQEEIRSVVGE